MAKPVSRRGSAFRPFHLWKGDRAELQKLNSTLVLDFQVDPYLDDLSPEIGPPLELCNKLAYRLKVGDLDRPNLLIGELLREVPHRRKDLRLDGNHSVIESDPGGTAFHPDSLGFGSDKAAHEGPCEYRR